MTSSNDTSRGQEPRRRSARPSSSPRPHSPTSAESFSLAGPSNPPDPAFHAFRPDLADAALAGRVIASHYADPVECRLASAAELRDAPAGDASVIRQLRQGEHFALLDSTLGWAWGYAGAERRVGYVESSKIGR